MDQENFIRGRLPAIYVWILLGVYACWLIYISPPITTPISWISVSGEGLLVLLSGLGLFAIREPNPEHHAYAPSFIGLSILLFAFGTDLLDEFIDMPPLVNDLVEKFGQDLGLLLVLISLRNWRKENHSLIHQLKHLATTDELTGVMNRRHFMDIFEREIASAERFGHAVSIAMVDIDHFKRINDQHGHATGDLALRKFCNHIEAHLRKTDILCRYGGEEFLIAMPFTDIDGAAHLLEKIRLSLSNIRIPNVRQITASFGVAQHFQEELLADVIARADSALYRAKESGRNKVLVDLSH